MADPVISIENLSKSYRLGVIGTGTFYGDLKRWWAAGAACRTRTAKSDKPIMATEQARPSGR